MISATVTNGNRSVGMLSFSGITGLLVSLCPPGVGRAGAVRLYGCGTGARAAASSHGCRASPSSANVQYSVNLVARD